MVTNDNEARKKQKITEAVDNGGNSLLPTTNAVVVPPVLSFGNILKEFPDFLFCVLTYIADRVVWNSIASSNKDMYTKSKAIQPPWPLWYKLPSGYSDPIIAWSLCGTRMAYTIGGSLSIIDQRCGQFRNNGNYKNDLGWEAHDCDFITDLKFSPDGSFLVSIGHDGLLEYGIMLPAITNNYKNGIWLKNSPKRLLPTYLLKYLFRPVANI